MRHSEFSLGTIGLACPVSRFDWRGHHRTMKATGMEDNLEAKPLAQIERHSYSEVGWISRQNLLALRSRENFFLDIPFYRTDDGTAHPGTKDGRHYINHLEEGSGFRRQTIETASSLSVSRNDAFPSPTILSGGGRSGSQDARFEVSISQ